MAKTKISEFSATPANNTDIDSINIAEGCSPSGINDAIRELMAQLKDFQTGAVGDSFNGPVGTTTAAAGAFTTLSASSTVSGTGFSTYLASPPAIGGTAAAAGSFTTLSASGNVTLSGGTANGVAYLNGSKVVTSGSALTFDGTYLGVGTASPSTWSSKLAVLSTGTSPTVAYINGSAASNSNTVSTEYWLPNSFTGLDKAAIFGAINSGSGNNNGSFYWSLASAGSPSEQMRLTSTGLGIGTTSNRASTKLDVRGNISFGSNASYYGQIGYDAGTGTIDLTSSDGGFRFIRQSGSVTSATLDSSGNLGLGVTPSAWATVTAMQVKAASLGGYSSTGYLNANAYYNAGWKYINTLPAARYEINAGDTGAHQWFTAATGTAGNAITFTQAMTLDASGQLGIGATSPSQKLDVRGSVYVQRDTNPTNALALQLTNQTTTSNNGCRLSFDAYNIGSSALGVPSDSASLAFYTGGVTTERARIDSSGNLLVGTTSDSGAKFIVSGDFSSSFGTRVNTTASVGYMTQFQTSGTERGYIYSSSSGTTYNTVSDYRLKNTIAPMTGALAKVALLKPCTYKWNADGSSSQGFIAHELAEVVPQCVTGEKDAVDENGNPKYQGIDTSFLVATLTAAIQELKAEFDAYKASHP